MNKSNSFLLVVALMISAPAFSQLPKFLAPGTAAGYMGLFDWGGSYGFMNHSEHRSLLNNYSEDTKTNGQFLKFHFQESLLSNYFWSNKQDKRFKFGIVELLEIGVSYAKTTVATDAPFNPEPAPRKKIDFVFSYEGGLGAVYKINNMMDAGLSYYLLSISTFNDKNGDHPHYAKFRFRYSHLMAELSTLGRNAIDLKYLKQGEEDRSYTPYIGLTYTGWKNASVPAGSFVHKASFVYLTIGGIF